MAASGQKPERLPELAIAVHINTTIHRSEILVNHGFQQFDHSFDRTAVIQKRIQKILRLGHNLPEPFSLCLASIGAVAVEAGFVPIATHYLPVCVALQS